MVLVSPRLTKSSDRQIGVNDGSKNAKLKHVLMGLSSDTVY